MRVYVASSWRNEYQQSVVRILRSVGHELAEHEKNQTRLPPAVGEASHG